MSDHPTLPLGEPEQWRPVVGWEGLYEVSDQGRVRSLNRRRDRYGKLLKPTYQPSTGYFIVGFRRGAEKKAPTIHSLVAAAFIGPRPPGLVTLHGAGGSLDNRLANLSYGTVSQNALDRYRDGTMILGERHHAGKLSDAKVCAIRMRRAAGEHVNRLALEYGVSTTTIKAVVNRQTWKHVA